MIKAVLFALSLGVAGTASAAETPEMQAVYETLKPIMDQYPEVTQVEVCLTASNCEVFENEATFRKGGNPELLYERPKNGDDGAAGAVGAIVGAVGKSTGAGGRIVVDYEKKEKDGSSLKIHVEVSAGVGSGASAAAGGSSPATLDTK